MPRKVNRFEDNFDKNFNRIFGLAILGTIVSWVVGVGLLGVLVYVGWHFLSRVW